MRLYKRQHDVPPQQSTVGKAKVQTWSATRFTHKEAQ
jgi:hypothetical protein